MLHRWGLSTILFYFYFLLPDNSCHSVKLHSHQRSFLLWSSHSMCLVLPWSSPSAALRCPCAKTLCSLEKGKGKGILKCHAWKVSYENTNTQAGSLISLTPGLHEWKWNHLLKHHKVALKTGKCVKVSVIQRNQEKNETSKLDYTSHTIWWFMSKERQVSVKTQRSRKSQHCLGDWHCGK